VRHFSSEEVDPATIRELVRLACLAPAPHHSRPWRFVTVASEQSRTALADAMSDSWLADLIEANRGAREVTELISRSRAQVLGAPALLVACLSMTGRMDWPDEPRRTAERDMFVQSLGAALQNLLLAAEELGLAAYLKGAPLFCSPAIGETLKLPDDWDPAFLVLLGHPDPGFTPPPREPVPLADVLLER
jgi:coenzyme F420-0:L-glutamate ligase/coenzyme F420-1:gamma-L-glutamate ligase